MTSFDLEYFNRDHFELLGLPRRQQLDALELDRLYQDIQARVHPDKHAHLGDADRRLAMQWATRVNEAYQTLKSPLRRAEYLLRLNGHDPEVERNTAMPADFLIEQMEWRERVEAARDAGDIDALDALHRDVRGQINRQYSDLVSVLDSENAYGQAAQMVRQLMFREKLLHDIDEALAVVEA
jgi:molecular chaperone HscB